MELSGKDDYMTENKKHASVSGDDPKPQEQNKKEKKQKSKAKYIISGIIAIDVLLLLYFVAIFSNIPFVVKLRTLYIETAMSTTSHQWLATYFIPKSVIDEVMELRERELALQSLLDGSWGDNEDKNINMEDAEDFFELYWELDTDSVMEYLQQNKDVLKDGFQSIFIEDLKGEYGLKTVKGDSVLLLDTANNLMILGVSGDGYVGKLAIVKDPAQIEMAKSDYLGSRGQIIDDYGEKCDALLAVNASGFKDVEGHGSGGEVRGSLVIDGVDYGDHSSGKAHWKFIGFQYDNRLYVTSYDRNKISDYKWAMEFSPALIVNGEVVAEGSYGWGIQPRTVIGQAEDGSFMILLVDGRQPGYSIGCTVGECAQILYRYNAYQAVNLDGGSSSVMWYGGEQITKSSSPSGFGRYLPNALIVKKAEEN